MRTQSAPLGWNRVKVAAKTWWGPFPHVPMLKFWMLDQSFLTLSQGAQYELTNIFLFFEIYNVNYKGEVRTQYLGFREKSNFYCPVSDKGSENCH